MNRTTQAVASDQRIASAAFWRDSLLTTHRLSLFFSKLLREPAARVRLPVIQAGIALLLDRIYANIRPITRFSIFLGIRSISTKIKNLNPADQSVRYAASEFLTINRISTRKRPCRRKGFSIYGKLPRPLSRLVELAARPCLRAVTGRRAIRERSSPGTGPKCSQNSLDFAAKTAKNAPKYAVFGPFFNVSGSDLPPLAVR
jgi:hypothetical protein